MANAPHTSKSIETGLFLKRLAQAGLSLADLARRVGVDEDYLRQQISRSFPLRKLRYRIEGLGLGFRFPIWSSRRELTLRKKCLELCGQDPLLMGKPVLRSLAVQLGAGLTRSQKRIRRLLIARLLEYLSTHTPAKIPA